MQVVYHLRLLLLNFNPYPQKGYTLYTQWASSTESTYKNNYTNKVQMVVKELSKIQGYQMA
jgi:hypothetical protein